MAKNRHNKRLELLLVSTVYSALIFGLITTSGTLFAGPQLFDENQIYRLKIELSEETFAQVATNEVITRITSYNRFVPVFSFHKVLQAALLGTNLVAWSLYTGLLGVLTGVFLFHGVRLLGFNLVEALIFSLLTFVGSQSVIWWRLIQGEGLAMLFLAISLVCMARSAVSGDKRTMYTVLFVTFAALSSASKESFILLLPALGFWYIWTVTSKNECQDHSIKKSAVIIVVLGSIFIAELVFIRYFIRRTSTGYGIGWKGLDLEKTIDTTREFTKSADTSLLLIFFVALFVIAGYQSARARRIKATWIPLLKEIFLAMVLSLMTAVPQLLLYSNSGIKYPRYLLPAMIGYAFLVTSVLRHIRLQIEHAVPNTLVYSHGPISRQHHGIAFLKTLIVIAIVVPIAFHLRRGIQKAYESAGRYTEQANRINDWFDSIESATDAADSILVVFDSKKGLGTPARIKFILHEKLGRHNLHYYPYPPIPAGSRIAGARDWRKHVGETGKLNVDQLQKLNAILLPRSEPTTKKDFLEYENRFLFDSRSWLNTLNYERRISKVGYVSYYRKEFVPLKGKVTHDLAYLQSNTANVHKTTTSTLLMNDPSALLAHPKPNSHSSIRYPALSIPPHACLVFGIDLINSGKGDGVEFIIEVDSDILFRRIVEGQGRYGPLYVSLEAYGRQEIEMEFKVDPLKSNHYDVAYWLNPQILVSNN